MPTAPRVLVIDYRTGNSQSVAYALGQVGVDHQVARRPEEVSDITHVILPGVGSAGTTMRYLAEDGWAPFLTERVIGGNMPFLGVCVGLQVIFDHSEEQDATCLGWLPGRVRAFDRTAVRVPHMGWSQVAIRSAHPWLAGFPDRQYVYFVNSYYADPADPAVRAGVTEYGVPFAAIVASGNIMATQFHIEKSGPVGLALLERFANLPPEVLA